MLGKSRHNRAVIKAVSQLVTISHSVGASFLCVDKNQIEGEKKEERILFRKATATNTREKKQNRGRATKEELRQQQETENKRIKGQADAIPGLKLNNGAVSVLIKHIN